MSWSEQNRVEYVFGLARSARLEAMIAAELAEAKAQVAATGQPARVFKELVYATRDSLFRKSFPRGQRVRTGTNSAVGLRSTRLLHA